MKTKFLHIRINDEDEALIEKLKGNKTTTEYILSLIRDHDRKAAIEEAIQNYKNK